MFRREGFGVLVTRAESTKPEGVTGQAVVPRVNHLFCERCQPEYVLLVYVLLGAPLFLFFDRVALLMTHSFL